MAAQPPFRPGGIARYPLAISSLPDSLQALRHIVIQRDGDVFQLKGDRVVEQLGRISLAPLRRLLAAVDGMRPAPLSLGQADTVCVAAPLETYSVQTAAGHRFVVHRTQDCREYWPSANPIVGLVVGVLDGWRSLAFLE